MPICRHERDCRRERDAPRRDALNLALLAVDSLQRPIARVRAGLRRVARDESGATAIEYGLIIGGISIAILATVFAIGDHLDDLFTIVESRMHSRFSTM